MKYPCQNCNKELEIPKGENSLVHNCKIEDNELLVGIYESVETSGDENNNLVQNKIVRKITKDGIEITITKSTDQEVEEYKAQVLKDNEDSIKSLSGVDAIK